MPYMTSYIHLYNVRKDTSSVIVRCTSNKNSIRLQMKIQKIVEGNVKNICIYFAMMAIYISVHISTDEINKDETNKSHLCCYHTIISKLINLLPHANMHLQTTDIFSAMQEYFFLYFNFFSSIGQHGDFYVCKFICGYR